ncbi:hypothetical protein EJ04DRAFT_436375 [Polyplosphaeria fusca]|uniref:F-box domain-containing protein n=1 Tax=Polyplosphaeria fusca TaxID=682080 RepID=A0A9P4V009_9PLEO|nr:hypothetical protein EJ04DRAFT_436375 [Polyplosphaeria fusca]
MDEPSHSRTLLTLPAELRLHIFSYLLQSHKHTARALHLQSGATPSRASLCLDADYLASHHLRLLLVCRRFRDDLSALAFRHTQFLVTDIYGKIATKLNVLQPWQLENVRDIAFVAGAQQFKEMVHWRRHPFNLPDLRLESLTVVLHRSSHWHYLSNYTTDMVGLLRRLEKLQVLKFVQNAANVKGFFKTWCNRLIGLILKVDHFQRYDAPGAPNMENSWWDWAFDDAEQSFTLTRSDPKPVLAEEEYMGFVKPAIDKLMESMEAEEEDPDPRARLMYY